MMFSIIIPVKEINQYIIDFVPLILKQSYKKFEIIILPNDFPKKIPETLKNKKIKIIPSGAGGPAMKRDLGAEKSKGDILAFIDDDAYPSRDWLEKAEKEFNNDSVSAIGGPNLTPEKSNFFQKVSGDVLASYLVSAGESGRYKIGKRKEIDDFPSCNLLIRKKVFKKVGGFDTGFWPGEDTKLCLDIKEQGGKIIYSPEVIVYHHRRKTFKEYLKQIFSYAKHRGYFAKKYPGNSAKLGYMIPSLFVLGLVTGGVLSYFSFIVRIAYLGVLSLYGILLLVESVKTKKINYIIPFVIIAFTTHITYGVGVFFGLFKKNLVSKYRT